MSLRIKRLSDAVRYDAPNHVDVRALRLQGFENDGPTSLWLGVSYFLPDGGAGPDAGPLEKVYLVLSGQMTLRAQGQTWVLGAMDSVCIPPNVEREIRNEGNEVATMLVTMPYPAKT